ncbi:hypothetical protein GGF32_002372 [Allomyces javanicus]|nr:hypothetical protein GGF32_002372 [Allomyces javanicus]
MHTPEPLSASPDAPPRSPNHAAVVLAGDKDLAPATPPRDRTASHESTGSIEVTHPDNYLTKAAKMLDDLGSNYKPVETADIVWNVESWAKLRTENRVTSPPITLGGRQWRILCFPNGNNADKVALYVMLDDWEGRTSAQAIPADFVLGMVHPENDTQCHFQYSNHRFGEIELDWGFTHFVALASLGQYVHQDRTLLFARIRVLEDETGVLFHSFKDYHSKTVSGHVGLKNQGATCYMNSILQSLFCTNYFRKAVYQIPLPKDDEHASKSVTLSLQRLFYFMQTSDDAVETNELTKSFGWNTVDAFAQHDVQEFLRVLTDNLEEKMKGTPADGMIQRLFVGQMKSYIKCVNVDYESSRTEDFYDIQLNVKGMPTVYDSFRDYIQVETLEGENKYMAEGYGLQDAKKGVVFTKFPSVLHLQLKRFEYDFMRDQMVKINDRYEFPLDLDLDEFLVPPTPAEGDEEAADVPPPGPQKYHLHGVLVHSGSVDGGHYCAFIRPRRENKWFKFDDDRVVPVTLKEVLDDNFGGEYPAAKRPGLGGAAPRAMGMVHKRFTNAYMLVYLRESDYDTTLCDVTENDVPAAIRDQLDRERQEHEARLRDIREREFMLHVRIIDDAAMRNYSGLDLWSFGGANVPNGEWNKRFHKHETAWPAVQKAYAADRGIPEERLRFWLLTPRENKTLRPDAENVISGPDMQLNLETLQKRHTTTPNSWPYEIRVYAEVLPESETADAAPVAEPTDADVPPLEVAAPLAPAPTPRAGYVSATMLLFIKAFDVVSQTLTIKGHLQVPRMTLPRDIIPQVAEMLGVPAGTDLRIFEEVHATLISPIDPARPFATQEMTDGDIMAVEPVLDDAAASIATLPPGTPRSVAEYYEYLQNRADVVFKPRHPHPDGSESPAHPNPVREVALSLSKRVRYDDVAARVAHELGLDDPMKLRFTSTYVSEMPRSVIRPTPSVTLGDMLGAAPYQFRAPLGVDPIAAPPVTVLYEVLDVSIKEFESKRSVRATVLVPGKEESVDVLVPKTSTTGTVLAALADKAGIPTDLPVRLYEVIGHKITREFAGHESLTVIPEYTMFVVQAVPVVEGTVHHVGVVHMNRTPSLLHGTPFKFPVVQGEAMAATKKRVQQYLGYSDKDMTKVAFKLVPLGALSEQAAKEVEDDQILADLLVSGPVVAVAPPAYADAVAGIEPPTPAAVGAQEVVYSSTIALALDHPQRRQSRMMSSLERGLRIFN